MRLEIERPLAWPVAGVPDLHNAGPSILIVSADQPLADRLRDVYRRNGHRIHVVASETAALEALGADPGIGIVVARHAADDDALAFVERIRASQGGRRLVFVLVAENPDVGDVVQAMHMGVADFVSDPTDGARLHDALVRALSAAQPGAEASTSDRTVPRDQALDEAYRHGLALIAAVESLRRAAPAEPVPAQIAEPPAGASITPLARSKARAVEPPASASPSSASRRVDLLRALQRARAARDRLFPKGLFEDPCWDMLLDLTINDALGKRISVSSLCVASGVAQTTALRRIADLSDRGLVRRVADERDGRRVFIELTEEGRAAMARYADQIERMP